MGTSATERIALLVETRADLSGTQAARSDVSALGQASRDATTVAAAGMANLTVSTEQMRAALAASNGDLAAATRLLAAQAQAADKAATSLKSVAAAQGTGRVLSGPSSPQLGPGLPGMTAERAAELSRAAAAVDVNARKAGNAMNIMAASAAAGHGSVAGLATAAGNVAQEMALMSKNATIAASAAGIGVLIAGLGVLVAVAVEAKRALEDLPEGKLAASADAHVKNLRTQKQVSEEIERIDARRAALQEQLGSFGGLFGGEGALDKQKATLQQIANLDAQRLATFARGREIEVENRRLSEAAEKAAQRKAEERDKRALEKKRLDNDYVLTLAGAAAAAQIALTKDEFQRRRELVENEAQSERQAAEKRRLSTDDMKAALDEINRKRLYSIELINREAAVAKQKQIDQGLQGYAKLSQAAILHGSIVSKVSQTAADAVRRYEILVQAKKDALLAKSEFAAATAAFASGNIPGGALHLAAAGGYAAAAVAGGAEAVSGGGGAGAGGGGGATGSGTTFTPRDSSGSTGAQTLVLQTVNPFSKEVISEAIYQINRSNTLKRPILIAPTTGLVGAA